MTGSESTDSRAMPTGACPSDEDIAAFLDGMLAGEERARVVAHLAACKDCYEVFAGVLSFEQETAKIAEEEKEEEEEEVGQLVPFPLERTEERKPVEPPRRQQPGRLRWLPAAAAAVVVFGIGYGGFKAFLAPPQPSPMTVASLTAALVSRPEAAQHTYKVKQLRGGKANLRPQDLLDRERPAFMVGVLLVDQRLAPSADRLRQISDELANVPRAHEVAEGYRRDKERAESSAAVGPLEAELDKTLDDRNGGFAFGKWAEACRLAAVAQTPDFFTSRSNHDYLSVVLARAMEAAKGASGRSNGGLNLRAARAATVADILGRTSQEWTAGEPPQDYQAIARDFKQLIGLYDH